MIADIWQIIVEINKCYQYNDSHTYPFGSDRIVDVTE